MEEACKAMETVILRLFVLVNGHLVRCRVDRRREVGGSGLGLAPLEFVVDRTETVCFRFVHT